MGNRAIILTALLLAAACKPATEMATASPSYPGPAAIADDDPGRTEPPEIFPVPPGTACTIRGAWSTDTDPAGLNVRASPSPTAPVVGKLPPPKYVAEFDRVMKTGFRVREARQGWFLISDAYPPDQVDFRTPSTLPTGWISGRYVGFELQTERAFVSPDPSSAVAAANWTENGAERRFTYRHPVECRGEWVRLSVTGRDGREREGWARGVCDGQETSCDGALGDGLRAGERF